MDQDQIMTRDILLKECFIIGLYCIIQCAAFFCDKIIFDTFQFYFFIRYCFKTKKVHVQNKILPYKSDLCYILFALFTLNSFK